ncbi:MAG: hypothetical protein JWO19_49 [Bryobacterales bacterium]|jgi:hypothetical protein|nr:hypothetical protein [Bryobacterales bacterium]
MAGKMATHNFAELKRQTQKNLVGFLRIEVQLASTFCEMVERSQSPEHKAQLLEDIRKAVRAIRHFEQRIIDPSIRADVLKKADTLDAFCRENRK